MHTICGGEEQVSRGHPKGGWPTCVNFLLQAEQMIDFAPRKSAFKRTIKTLKGAPGWQFPKRDFFGLARAAATGRNSRFSSGMADRRTKAKPKARSKEQILTREWPTEIKRENTAPFDCALVRVNSTQERRLIEAVTLTLTRRNRIRFGGGQIPGIHAIALGQKEATGRGGR